MLETILSEIKSRKEQVISPRPSSIPWTQKIESEFEGYPVFDWTDDFNYSKCHTYEVVLHLFDLQKPKSSSDLTELVRKMEGAIYSIILKVSVIQPYYLIGLLKRSAGENQKITEKLILPQCNLHQDMLTRLEKLVENERFQKIQRELLKISVPEINLELAQFVTVYNCLFEDQDSSLPIIWY